MRTLLALLAALSGCSTDAEITGAATGVWDGTALTVKAAWVQGDSAVTPVDYLPPVAYAVIRGSQYPLLRANLGEDLSSPLEYYAAVIPLDDVNDNELIEVRGTDVPSTNFSIPAAFELTAVPDNPPLPVRIEWTPSSTDRMRYWTESTRCGVDSSIHGVDVDGFYRDVGSFDWNENVTGVEPCEVTVWVERHGNYDSDLGPVNQGRQLRHVTFVVTPP